MKPRRLAGILPNRISLRTRLTVIYAAMFLVAGVVLLGTTYALFDQQLSNAPSSFSSSVDEGDPTTRGDDEPPPHNEIVTDSGEVLTNEAATDWLQRQGELLRESAVTSLVTQGGIALLVVAGVAAGMGWLVAGRVLGPLHRVTETARRIAAAPAADRGLHERIALIGPDDEVKELADTFDTMVARLDRSFDGQRRFVANASHELRTPLTLGRGLVELAMHRASASDDVKRLGEDLLEINSRHERLISGLLVLAGAENEVVERFPVDLADVIDHVVGQTAEEARTSAVVVRDDADETMTDGDALLLERLVHNLVENGIRHNSPDGGWVCVTSRVCPDAGLVELQVSNTGPVIPPYEVPALFEPFRRLGPDRLTTNMGAGLGLSIVRAIARAHGGDAIAHPRDRGGLVATVTLPASSDATTVAEL